MPRALQFPPALELAISSSVWIKRTQRRAAWAGQNIQSKKTVGGWGGGSSWNGQERRLFRSNRTWQDNSDCRERSLTHPTQPSMFCGKMTASCPMILFVFYPKPRTALIHTRHTIIIINFYANMFTKEWLCNALSILGSHCSEYE